MRYQFDTTLTRQDWNEEVLYILDHTPQGKKYATRYRLTVLLMLPIWWIVGYCLYHLTPRFYGYAAIMLVAEGIWQLLTKPLLRRKLQRQIRREEKRHGFGPSESIFYDDGFCDIADGVKVEVEYANVRKAVCYKRRYFFLHTEKTFFIVPCRALFGQVTENEFTDFLRSRGITVENIE